MMQRDATPLDENLAFPNLCPIVPCQKSMLSCVYICKHFIHKHDIYVISTYE